MSSSQDNSFQRSLQRGQGDRITSRDTGSSSYGILRFDQIQQGHLTYQSVDPVLRRQAELIGHGFHPATALAAARAEASLNSLEEFNQPIIPGQREPGTSAQDTAGAHRRVDQHIHAMDSEYQQKWLRANMRLDDSYHAILYFKSNITCDVLDNLKSKLSHEGSNSGYSLERRAKMKEARDCCNKILLEHYHNNFSSVSINNLRRNMSNLPPLECMYRLHTFLQGYRGRSDISSAIETARAQIYEWFQRHPR